MSSVAVLMCLLISCLVLSYYYYDDDNDDDEIDCVVMLLACRSKLVRVIQRHTVREYRRVSLQSSSSY